MVLLTQQNWKRTLRAQGLGGAEQGPSHRDTVGLWARAWHVHRWSTPAVWLNVQGHRVTAAPGVGGECSARSLRGEV